jgi:hypothetical protein
VRFRARTAADLRAGSSTLLHLDEAANGPFPAARQCFRAPQVQRPSGPPDGGSAPRRCRASAARVVDAPRRPSNQDASPRQRGRRGAPTAVGLPVCSGLQVGTPSSLASSTAHSYACQVSGGKASAAIDRHRL